MYRCVPYILLTDHLPTVFHTASVWLTVALAAQRYVQVCHPAPAKRICTIRNMNRIIVIVYLAAFCVQLPRMVDLNFGRVLVRSQVCLPTVHIVHDCLRCLYKTVGRVNYAGLLAK